MSHLPRLACVDRPQQGATATFAHALMRFVSIIPDRIYAKFLRARHPMVKPARQSRSSVAWKGLRDMLARFFTDRRANVASIFALAIIPVVGLTGMAVDYTRGNSMKTAVQAALDATALVMARAA